MSGRTCFFFPFRFILFPLPLCFTFTFSVPRFVYGSARFFLLFFLFLLHPNLSHSRFNCLFFSVNSNHQPVPCSISYLLFFFLFFFSSLPLWYPPHHFILLNKQYIALVGTAFSAKRLERDVRIIFEGKLKGSKCTYIPVLRGVPCRVLLACLPVFCGVRGWMDGVVICAGYAQLCL